MSYMKRLWEEQEYAKTLESVLASSQTAAPTPTPTGTVLSCIDQIELRKSIACRCPGCGNTDWYKVAIKGHTPCQASSDVLYAPAECCRKTRSLYRFIPTADEMTWVKKSVENWLQRLWKGQTVAKGTPIKVGLGLSPTLTPEALARFFDPIVGKGWKVKHTYGLDVGADPIPACEADKSIGTRDPDKFLKEQQDKLFREMMG